jgi:ribosomal-protein-alanine N-acetyltransferase
MKILETERLVLRRLSSDDAQFILDLLNQPSFLRYIGDKGVRTTEDAVRYIQTGPVASYERFGYGLYLVELKESGVPIGMCGLTETRYVAGRGCRLRVSAGLLVTRVCF